MQEKKETSKKEARKFFIFFLVLLAMSALILSSFNFYKIFFSREEISDLFFEKFKKFEMTNQQLSSELESINSRLNNIEKSMILANKKNEELSGKFEYLEQLYQKSNISFNRLTILELENIFSNAKTLFDLHNNPLYLKKGLLISIERSIYFDNKFREVIQEKIRLAMKEMNYPTDTFFQETKKKFDSISDFLKKNNNSYSEVNKKELDKNNVDDKHNEGEFFSWFKERLSEVIKISKNEQDNIIFLNPNETEKINKLLEYKINTVNNLISHQELHLISKELSFIRLYIENYLVKQHKVYDDLLKLVVTIEMELAKIKVPDFKRLLLDIKGIINERK